MGARFRPFAADGQARNCFPGHGWTSINTDTPSWKTFLFGGLDLPGEPALIRVHLCPSVAERFRKDMIGAGDRAEKLVQSMCRGLAEVLFEVRTLFESEVP